MSDIFISYAREDHTKTKVLAEALEQKGFTVWWDPKIVAGAQFDQVIKRELDAAKCIVVLWSKASVKSRWVKDEANIGCGPGYFSTCRHSGC